MTKLEITAALIAAGLDRYIVAGMWAEDEETGPQCFARFDDLDAGKPAAIRALVQKAQPIITDKGFVFEATR
jgi:hypothetical protein